MKLFRRLIFASLLLGVSAQADDSFFIPKDRTDVITPLICVPSKADPTEIITVNHNTTSLSIRITTGDINETFAFSGATLDDWSTRGTHCNPDASNICLETETDGCFFLHLHDEVLDGAVNYWAILIDDGQSTLMDTWVHIFVQLMEPADVESEVNDALTAFGGGVATDANVDASEDKIDVMDENVDQLETAIITNASGTDIAADIAAIPTTTEIWDFICEDQGVTYTMQECMSIILAEAAGTAVYTSGTRTWVVKDPSGTETRLTIVYGAELDGDRDTSTLAPLTP